MQKLPAERRRSKDDAWFVKSFRVTEDSRCEGVHLRSRLAALSGRSPEPATNLIGISGIVLLAFVLLNALLLCLLSYGPLHELLSLRGVGVAYVVSILVATSAVAVDNWNLHGR